MQQPKARRAGFTLVEVLVTVVVVGVLAAVVIPAITGQITAADPSRVVKDLGTVATAINAFGANVRTSQPGDVEDLANAISTSDQSLAGVAYSTGETARWQGPYLAKPLTPGNVMTGNAFPSGFSSFIQNDLVKCNSEIITNGAFCSSTPPLDYVVVKVAPLTAVNFEAINKQIDTDETAGSSTSQSLGKFRFDAVNGVGYYYATPISN